MPCRAQLLYMSASTSRSEKGSPVNKPAVTAGRGQLSQDDQVGTERLQENMRAGRSWQAWHSGSAAQASGTAS